MSEIFKNDSDYRIEVYRLAKYQYLGKDYQRYVKIYEQNYVGNVYKFSQWLSESQNLNNWTHLRVFARRNNSFINQYEKGFFIPAKPKN
ncbi:hypothetical protein SDC9_01512 [bioreactor metagenome]|uniref:Uncharacterized protein n=1 Tax=bioreactor metagenome TaxID=1076179 RepID=A0A644SMX9_9ZZZZ